MIRRVAASVSLFIVFIVLGLVFKSDDTRSAKTRNGDTGLYRIKGVILVSVRQSDSEVDYFSWNSAKGGSRLSRHEKRKLREYGLKKSRKAYQHNGRAIYSLRFDNNRDESRIIQYVKNLPDIEFVQYDYYPEFCAEPNDFFYQPDSEDSSKHWVPYDYNIIFGNSDDLRHCGTQALSYFDDYEHCCTSDDYINPCISFRDSLHLDDQWYLKFIQANKAWDIEDGDADVKIMVMDSGIDFTHPDLDGNMWNNTDDELGDMNDDGLPGSPGDDDYDLYFNYNDPEIRAGDLDGDGIPLYGDDAICDAGLDGDYGFGPNGIDDSPVGPGGGDDDTLIVGSGNDPWDDNLRGPASQNPDSSFNDDLDEIPFFRYDDNENGYPDDYYGFNFYDPVNEWENIWEENAKDGLPGVKGWTVDQYDGNDGIHFNDYDVRTSDFDGDGIALFGPDSICDAGPDGDYGFGLNARDDSPSGPGGGDDDSLVTGSGNDPWDDNLRGPASQNPDSLFDDDMDDVYYLHFDDEEDGMPLSLPKDDSCPKTTACHGTSMAGIIGSETNNTIGTAGFTWNCSLVAAKIAIGFPERTYEDWQRAYYDTTLKDGVVVPIVQALDYATDNDIDIVNMSLIFFADTSRFPLINRALEGAYDDGVILIASSGNVDDDINGYPATHPNVISVTGTNRFDQKASFTTYNDHVDMSAPVGDKNAEPHSSVNTSGCSASGNPVLERGSECMVTAYYQPPQPYMFWTDTGLPHGYATSGLATSGACAQASGLAALLVSFYPRSSFSGSASDYVDFIKAEMKRGCVELNDSLFTAGKLGAGRINAYRSLTQWGETGGEDVTWSGDIYVSTNYVVLTQDTLTIDAGTTVYFMPDNNDSIGSEPAINTLLVRGYLHAVGTSGNPITFRAFENNAEAGYWGGIRVLGDSASIKMSHCVVQDAIYGLRSPSTIALRSCEIKNCSTAGVYLWEDSTTYNKSTLDVCKISNNDSTDVSGIQIWNCDSVVVVDSCEFNYNGDAGLYISNASPEIRYTDVKNNGGHGIKMYKYYSTTIPEPLIYRCDIRCNGEDGIYDYQCEGDIQYTRSSDNETYGAYFYGAWGNPNIKRSKFVDNPTGIRSRYGLPVVGDSSDTVNTGFNTFDNDTYNLQYNDDPLLDDLIAQKCYWGESPPDIDKIIGNVDYSGYLTSDPVAYLAKAVNNYPTKVMLYQNFPNPLVGGKSTQIKFSLPKTEKVKITVYDVSGRRVRTLVDGIKQPGHHFVRWDGHNDKGARVATGIYFYQMKVGRNVMSKKIVLIR